MSYNISSIIYYHQMSRTEGGNEGDPMYSRVYTALCNAFGVPENWIEDQHARVNVLVDVSSQVVMAANREGIILDLNVDDGIWLKMNDEQRRKTTYSLKYIFYRIPFEQALMTSENDGGLRGPDMPFSDVINDLIGNLYKKTRQSLYELDSSFFSSVYGIDATRKFSEEELVSFGAPSTDELNAYWADNF